MKSLYKRIVSILILTVLAVVLFLSYNNAVAEFDPDYGEIWPVYCACQPNSEINIRAFPKHGAEVVGRVWPGDQLFTDGKKRGAWIHVIGASCDAGEGWIHKGYLSDAPVQEVNAEFITTQNKVLARRFIGGKIRAKLKKGTTVKVFFITGNVAITDYGYMITDYLEEKTDV